MFITSFSSICSHSLDPTELKIYAKSDVVAEISSGEPRISELNLTDFFAAFQALRVHKSFTWCVFQDLRKPCKLVTDIQTCGAF